MTFYHFLTVVGQRTQPEELPIYGDPYEEIALELIFPKGKPIFLLNGKMLQLLQPLDRDEENLSHIVFQVSACIPHSLVSWQNIRSKMNEKTTNGAQKLYNITEHNVNS